MFLSKNSKDHGSCTHFFVSTIAFCAFEELPTSFTNVRNNGRNHQETSGRRFAA
jgi:hypothetical protein